MAISDPAPLKPRCLAALYELEVLLIGVTLTFFFMEGGFHTLGWMMAVGSLAFFAFQTRLKSPKKLAGLGLYFEQEPAQPLQWGLRFCLKYALLVCLYFTFFPYQLAALFGGVIDWPIWYAYLAGGVGYVGFHFWVLSPWAPKHLRGRTLHDLLTRLQLRQESAESPVLLLRKIGGYALFSFIFFMLLTSQIGFIGSHSRVQQSMMKAQMHQLQIAVDTYFVEHNRYPSNLDVLKAAAQKGKYWKPGLNPYTEKPIQFKAYQSPHQPDIIASQLIFFVRYQTIGNAGVLLYVPRGQTGYAIYATDNRGELIQEKGKPFLLQNTP